MSRAQFEIALLNSAHDRTTFNSGSAPLDRYLREQVTQDVRRRVAACFVATTDGKCIAGYYTLASASLLLGELPASIAKKLPRYPTVPTVRMGPPGNRSRFQGAGTGQRTARRCSRPGLPLRGCSLRLDGGRQRRCSSKFLQASRLHRPARFIENPVFATGDRSSPLKCFAKQPRIDSSA